MNSHQSSVLSALFSSAIRAAGLVDATEAGRSKLALFVHLARRESPGSVRLQVWIYAKHIWGCRKLGYKT